MKFTNSDIRKANEDVALAFAVCGKNDPDNEIREFRPTTKDEDTKAKNFIAELEKYGFKYKSHQENSEDYNPVCTLRKADTVIHYAMGGSRYDVPIIQWIEYGEIACTCVCQCGANK